MGASNRVRGRASSVLVVLASLVFQTAEAEDRIEADLSCARRPDPGRVGCELSVESGSERQVLKWVDGLVVEVPSFLEPLRARITTELPTEGKARATVPLAFWASELGRGVVRIEVRAVLCPIGDKDSKRCAPVLVRISKQVTVG